MNVYLQNIPTLCRKLEEGRGTLKSKSNSKSRISTPHQSIIRSTTRSSRDVGQRLAQRKLERQFRRLDNRKTSQKLLTPTITILRQSPIEHHTSDKMLVQLRASTARSAASAISRVARVNAVRGFIAPTVSRRADFVQELYLKELKAYKPTPIKDSDSVGQVQTFTAPKTPKSPEEADLANSLKEYESMAVEVEGQDVVTPGSTPVVEDWLVEEEDEEPAHGH
ncbi:ATP synthase complex subunit H-domain-containing protein [Xylariales sp. AK1849]|nr:ATP synthase complex subunit H-domain-containing protein [Xylariales sp. AK1849]